MKYIVFIFLLFFTKILSFLGSNVLLFGMHYLTLFVSITSFLIFISRHRWSHVTFFIFMFAIITPIYASIQSLRIFDQPFYMGFASLRYFMFIMFGYFLIINNYDYRLLLKQINNINLFVALFSIITILILHIDPGTLYSYQVTNNVLGAGTENAGDSEGVGGVNVRGARFFACSALMFISLIYYQLASLRKGGKDNYIRLFILIIYILFVHKGRQPVAVMGVVYIVYFLKMKGVSTKRLLMVVAPILLFIIFLAIDENLLFRFTTILDGEKSDDFSTLARIWEVNQILPYIQDNLLLGVGNLSAHFRNGGFQAFLGSNFYLADIGIIGALARGGLILIIIYLGLYVSLWKKTKSIQDRDCRQYMRYMLISYAILLICLCNDTFFGDNCIQFALIFYPLYRQKNNNKYISPLKYNKFSKFIYV